MSGKINAEKQNKQESKRKRQLRFRKLFGWGPTRILWNYICLNPLLHQMTHPPMICEIFQKSTDCIVALIFYFGTIVLFALSSSEQCLEIWSSHQFSTNPLIKSNLLVVPCYLQLHTNYINHGWDFLIHPGYCLTLLKYFLFSLHIAPIKAVHNCRRGNIEHDS